MSLATDLLDQAEHLASRDRGRPKQASLRRAVSDAYYSLFHLLTEEASRRFASDPTIRRLVARAFSHGEMYKAARCFASGGDLPAAVAPAFVGRLPENVRKLADAFVNLQQARHRADYNLLASFARPEALAAVETARQAFNALAELKASKEAEERLALELFLTSLLLWDRWKG